MRFKSFIYIFFACLYVGVTNPVWAAPQFIITGKNSIAFQNTNTYSIYLYTGTDTVTAVSGIVNFDKNRLEGVAKSVTDSRCRFWSPASPTLNFGTNGTPYFYQDNKFVFSCGFSDGGYKSAAATGDLIASFSVKSIVAQDSTTTLSFSNTDFYYIGTPVVAGISSPFTLSVYGATEAATPTPMPTPTLAQDILTLDQLNFTELSTRPTGATTARRTTSLNALTATQSGRTVTALDNSIPNPPDMTPRPTEAPLVLPTAIPLETKNKAGEVLSVQSLRELFLPTKSTANQTVVLINLISLLTFLVILTILVWRLIVISRINKIRNRHMKELITGELSVLESKLSGETAQNREMTEALESLKSRVDNVKE